MQGSHKGKGLIDLMGNISANKISPPQGQGYTEGKMILQRLLKFEFKRYTSG